MPAVAVVVVVVAVAVVIAFAVAATVTEFRVAAADLVGQVDHRVVSYRAGVVVAAVPMEVAAAVDHRLARAAAAAAVLERHQRPVIG